MKRSYFERLRQPAAPEPSDPILITGSAFSPSSVPPRPRWIINPAAYTAVDKAEPDVSAVIRKAAVRINAAILYFSTDYAFNDSGTKPWRESDPPPLGVSGEAAGAFEAIYHAVGVGETTWFGFVEEALRCRELAHLTTYCELIPIPTYPRRKAPRQ